MVNPGGPESSLEAFLQAEMAEDASSLSVVRYLYPGHCCKHPDKDDMSFSSCTRRDVQDHEVGKSIVRPSMVRGMSTHVATVVQEGSAWLQPPASQILLKHIKFNQSWGIWFNQSWGIWPERNCSKLPDDTDV